MLQVMSFSINHQTINSDSSGPFWAFAAPQICDGKPGGDTQVKDIFKFLSLFYNKFWFFLICPSCALSEFQVSDRKVPCFNRRSRQCELDSIMLFCIDNDRFPQSAKKKFKYLHQIFESEVANGGNRHFPFKTHTQSILLGVSECLGKYFIFADVRGISKSAYVFLFAPFNIIPSLWVNWN